MKVLGIIPLEQALSKLPPNLSCKFNVTPTGCWQWTASINQDGYAQATYKCKNQGAHRLFYKLLVGEIPVGLNLDHLCRNRSCVNPSHLEPVTVQENIRRGELGKINREKTHCVHGHTYADAYIVRGWRVCATCQKAKMNARYQITRMKRLIQEAPCVC